MRRLEAEHTVGAESGSQCGHGEKDVLSLESNHEILPRIERDCRSFVQICDWIAWRGLATWLQDACHIGLREIVADKEQTTGMFSCELMCKAIANIQTSGVQLARTELIVIPRLARLNYWPCSVGRESRREEWTEQTKLAGMQTKYLDPARSGRRFRTSRSIASAASFGRSAASGAGFGGKVIFIKLKSRRGVASRVQKQIRLELAGLDVHATYSAGTDDGRSRGSKSNWSPEMIHGKKSNCPHSPG
jgi:hypothetical protein